MVSLAEEGREVTKGVSARTRWGWGWGQALIIRK